MTTSTPRVAITGLGIVSPLGSGTTTFWNNLCAGTSGVGRLTRLDPTPYPRDLAAEVPDFDELPEATDPALAMLGRGIAYGAAAMRMALADAGLPNRLADGNDCAVLVGSTMGNQDVAEGIVDALDLDESFSLSHEQATGFRRFRPSLLASSLDRRAGANGPAMTLLNACAAGNYAVTLGAERIRSGLSGMAIVGGADPFTRTCYTIFHRLSASSATACRPFDGARDGIVVGEGAAFLVLEDMAAARARGARIYAEVSGYCIVCDAYHATAPHPDGDGAVSAMKQAMSMAGVTPDGIDCISAHGTATVANDLAEARGMHRIFGDLMPTVPISAIKGALGHCMGAASAMEAVACALSIHHQLVPPTLNTRASDAGFPSTLDTVPGDARPARLRHVLSNAFAFGGNVASVVFSAPDASRHH
ncbi:MAG: beta-ketoacyl-[acyl-carrier-protein] synthase family protein [Cupriavidus sp.]|nr:beta-ketoacyl-[acyl-carrier-protein] synthase family protein [Cupriavidus sp.]